MIVKYFTAELQKCNLGSDKIFLEQVNCSSRFTRMPFGRNIEYALKTSFYRISYTDRNGNPKNAVRQGLLVQLIVLNIQIYIMETWHTILMIRVILLH